MNWKEQLKSIVVEHGLPQVLAELVDYEQMTVSDMVVWFNNRLVTTTVINDILIHCGYQTRIGSGAYTPTEIGLPYAVTRRRCSGKHAGAICVTRWVFATHLEHDIRMGISEYLQSKGQVG